MLVVTSDRKLSQGEFYEAFRLCSWSFGGFCAESSEICWQSLGKGAYLSTRGLRPMRRRLQIMLRKIRTRSGATLTEYAVILFLVSVAAILVLQGIGGHTNNMVSSINNGFGP